MTGISRIGAQIVAAFLGLSSAQGALAACTQANATGAWQAYSINSDGDWVRCRISIGSTGIIPNNTCFTSLNTSATMTNGRVRLSVASTCTYTGNFTLFGIVNTIRHATMSLDKISVEGVGTYPGGSFNFSLTKL